MGLKEKSKIKNQKSNIKMQNGKPKLVYSSSISAALAVIVITMITIWGELSAPFKAWLASFTGHHWLTKSALSLLVYFGGLVLFYLLPKNIGHNTLRRGLIFLIIITLAGSLAVFLFFVWHYFWV